MCSLVGLILSVFDLSFHICLVKFDILRKGGNVKWNVKCACLNNDIVRVFVLVLSNQLHMSPGWALGAATVAFFHASTRYLGYSSEIAGAVTRKPVYLLVDLISTLSSTCPTYVG